MNEKKIQNVVWEYNTHPKGKYKTNQAITLIALVVTIIILLILAGIAILQLSGSGILEKAKLAEQKSKESQKEEQDILKVYEQQIEEIASNTDYNGKVKQNITITDITATTFKINVNSVDVDNVKKLYYYVNNNLVYEGKESFYTVTGLSENTDYNVIVVGDKNDMKVRTGKGDDINTWLACIGNTSGYTLDEIIANKNNILTNLLNSKEAKNYLAKSTQVILPAILESSAKDLIISSMIPKMSSNTSSNGFAFATTNAPNREAYRAFDGGISDGWQSSLPGNNIVISEQYLYYTFNNQVCVNSTSIANNSNEVQYNYGVQDYEFQYYDGTKWVTLGTGKINKGSINTSTITFSPVIGTQFRWHVLTNHGGYTDTTGINIAQIYGFDL